MTESEAEKMLEEIIAEKRGLSEQEEMKNLIADIVGKAHGVL